MARRNLKSKQSRKTKQKAELKQSAKEREDVLLRSALKTDPHLVDDVDLDVDDEQLDDFELDEPEDNEDELEPLRDAFSAVDFLIEEPSDFRAPPSGRVLITVTLSDEGFRCYPTGFKSFSYSGKSQRIVDALVDNYLKIERIRSLIEHYLNAFLDLEVPSANCLMRFLPSSYLLDAGALPGVSSDPSRSINRHFLSSAYIRLWDGVVYSMNCLTIDEGAPPKSRLAYSLFRIILGDPDNSDLVEEFHYLCKTFSENGVLATNEGSVRFFSTVYEKTRERFPNSLKLDRKMMQEANQSSESFQVIVKALAGEDSG